MIEQDLYFAAGMTCAIAPLLILVAVGFRALWVSLYGSGEEETG